jgi:signal transduction histidine kinase
MSQSWMTLREGDSQSDQLVTTLLHRMIVALSVQGIAVVFLGRLFGLRYLGFAYLVIASSGVVLQRKYGSAVAWRSGYFLALAGLVPYALVSGGIYSHAVISLAMLTVTSAFFFKLRTTFWVMAIQGILMGVMAFLQTEGLWFKTTSLRSPGVAWLLLTLLTVNYAIPLVTTIEAYRGVLSQLEGKMDALRVAEAETRSLLDSQSRYFWDISHELRSPITRLNLSVGKLRRETGSHSNVALGRMENEVERLNKLIQQLLLFAQLKQGVQFPMNERFDVAGEAGSVCSDAEFEANVNGKDLIWDCDVSLHPCFMMGCAELLRGALDNVVRNAIRFAPEGSKVIVRLRPVRPGIVLLAVEDQGPGVPEAQIGMLFDPFFRVPSDSQSPRRHNGSGLGLAIAYEAVKKHGGQIEAINRKCGGLRVTMEIPGILDATETKPE